jgi:hypothetical protein
MTIRVNPAWLATLLLVASPTAALACPLCIAAQDEAVQVAYIFATGFMTFLPFALVGGLIYWLRRRARQLALEEAAGVIRLPTPGARPNRAA